MDKVTITGLARNAAKRGDISLKNARALVVGVFDDIVDAVSAGNKVSITGFGNIERKVRIVKAGTREVFGNVVKVKGGERVKITFRAAKAFKDAAL